MQQKSTLTNLSHNFTNSIFIGTSSPAEACLVFPSYQPVTFQPWNQLHTVVLLLLLRDPAFRICWGSVLHVLKDTVCSLLLAWFQLSESSSTGLHIPTCSGINFFKWKSLLIEENDSICHHFENNLLWEVEPMLLVLLPPLSPASQLLPFMLVASCVF